MPRKASSRWKSSATNWLPWSWRSFRPRGDALGEGAEAGAHALAQRLERLEAGRPAGGVDADAFGRAVIDRDEDRGLALAGQGRGQVGAPHRVDPLGADRAVVGLRAVRPADPARRQQAVLPHQPQDAALGGADAGEAQPRPDLAMALAVERAGGQQLADRLDQRLVRHRPERPRPAPRARLGRTGDGDTAWRATCPRPGSPAACRKARLVEGETWRLMVSTSAVPKGGHLPGARSWPPAARWPWSARRPWP